MNTTSELTQFKDRCQQLFTCFTFATTGLEMVAGKFHSQLNGDSNQSLFIGSSHPYEGNVHSKVRMAEVVKNSEKDGPFSDTLAKSLLVLIYCEWDELFRHRFAAEVGTKAENVSCDLMGDLRWVRHWIVHNKYRIDRNCNKIKILSGSSTKGLSSKLRRVCSRSFSMQLI